MCPSRIARLMALGRVAGAVGLGLAAALAVAGCQTAATPKPTTRPPLTSYDLWAACEGKAVEGAALYTGEFHPLIVASAPWTLTHIWNWDWKTLDVRMAVERGISIDPAPLYGDPSWLDTIQLVVCVDEETILLGSCGYYGDVFGHVEKFRYELDWVTRVVVARTATTLEQQKVFKGPPPTCPERILESMDVVGDPPPFDDAKAWLSSLMTGPPRTATP